MFPIREFRKYFQGREHIYVLSHFESLLWCDRDLKLREFYRDNICKRAADFALSAECDFACILLADGRLASMVSCDYVSGFAS